MMQHHRYSLHELDSMIPWEREIYVDMLITWIREEKERLKAEQAEMAQKQGNRR